MLFRSTDNQAVSWLRSKRDVNRFMARWLDELEEFRFDVEHVPGRLNPADPLSRRGCPAAPGPPSPLSPPTSLTSSPPSPAHPPPAFSPAPAAQLYSAAGAALTTGTAQSGGLAHRFLAPDFLAAWQREVVLDPLFGPILAGASEIGRAHV